jgi:hypothetical protein
MCFKVPKGKLRARMSRKNAEHCRHLLYISSPRLTWSSIARNRQQSPLLRLPPEIRNRIYGLVLGGKQIQVCDAKNCASRHRCRSRKQKNRYDTYFHLRRRDLALLVSCHQIHEETKLLPFNHNEFEGHHWNIHLAVYHRLTDAQVSTITNVRVHVNNEDVNYFQDCDDFPAFSIRLSDRFLSTLQVLAHLRGLNKITVVWARKLQDGSRKENCAILKDQLLERVGSEMKQIARGADIEVVVLLSERELVNVESDSVSEAATCAISWRLSRPNDSAHQK